MTTAGAAWAIAKNELRLWFLSPSGWVFLAASLFLAGLFFTVSIATTGEASLRPALPNLAVTLVFTLPLVSMRQLADEARSGTLELLLTAPVPLAGLLLGKWAATLALCTALLVATAPFPLVLNLYGDPDPGALFTGYLGLWCCCALFAAVGLFASACTTDPTVAGVIAVALLLPSWLASSAAELAPPALAPLLERLAFVDHLRSFARGVVDSADLAWFGLGTGLFLFLTWRVLESRRWR
ncbi:MAG: ABC transporter permease [Myxococcota bacterium]